MNIDGLKQLKTPLLFLIFNRPDLTKIVFERIREVRPKYLYLAADGPRINQPEDFHLCEKARRITLERIDWDCEVKTLFREVNLGCGLGVSQAIDWFFENVEEGIILEDDCFPSFQFFNFSEYLLNKFRRDQKVMHVSGGCYLPEKYFGHESYYFTKYPFSWGWATWKSSWNQFEYDIAGNVQYPIDMLSDEISYWSDIYQKIKHGVIDTWAWRWNFSIWSKKGLCISSSKNLIKNLGFENGTHMKKKPFHYRRVMFYDEAIEIYRDSLIETNTKADRLVFDRYNLNKVSFLDRLGI